MESASDRFFRLASVLIPYVIRARSSETPVQGVANRGGHWQAWCFDLRYAEGAFLVPTPVSVFFMDSMWGEEMFDKKGVATIMYICVLLTQHSDEWLQGMASCSVKERRGKLAEAFPDPLVSHQSYCERVKAVMVSVHAQQNAKDCGIFAVMFLWELSRGVKRKNGHAELTDVDISECLRGVTQKRVTDLRKSDFACCLDLWRNTVRNMSSEETMTRMPYHGTWRPTPRELEKKKLGNVRIGRDNKTKGAKLTLTDLASLCDHRNDRDSWVASTYVASKAEIFWRLHQRDHQPYGSPDVFLTDDKVKMAGTL